MLLMYILASLAVAASPRDARAFFEDFVDKSRAFDPSLVEMVSDDAVFRAVVDGAAPMELSGAQWKAAVVAAIDATKATGDHETFTKVKVKRDGDRFRVTAQRHDPARCTTDDAYRLVLTPANDSFLVVEEHRESLSLSQCPPSPALTTALTQVRDALLPMLPLTLDDETVLEAVSIEGSALVYGMRLVKVAEGDISDERLRATLAKLSVGQICTDPAMRALVDDGAMVRYGWAFRDGTAVANVDVDKSICELVDAEREP